MQACPECRRAVVFEASRVTRPFARQLLGVFRYPLDAESAPYWIGVALVCGVLSWASALGTLFGLCIFVGYLFTVIRSSASGATQPPMAADFLEVMDLLRPLLQSAVAVVVVSVPAILVAYFGEGLEAQLLAGGLFLFGLLWLPLALIAAAHADSVFDAFNPLTTVRLFQRLPVAYAQVLLALLGLGLLASVSAFVVVPVHGRVARAAPAPRLHRGLPAPALLRHARGARAGAVRVRAWRRARSLSTWGPKESLPLHSPLSLSSTAWSTPRLLWTLRGATSAPTRKNSVAQ